MAIKFGKLVHRVRLPERRNQYGMTMCGAIYTRDAEHITYINKKGGLSQGTLTSKPITCILCIGGL